MPKRPSSPPRRSPGTLTERLSLRSRTLASHVIATHYNVAHARPDERALRNTGDGHHEQGGVAGVHEDPQGPPAGLLPDTFRLQLQGPVSRADIK